VLIIQSYTPVKRGASRVAPKSTSRAVASPFGVCAVGDSHVSIYLHSSSEPFCSNYDMHSSK
jgi:hypothetical protein